MSDNMRGKYFCFTSASLVAGQDIIARAETLTGISPIVAKQITVISSGSLSFDINHLGAYSVLPLSSGSINKLFLSDSDNWISSVVIGEETTNPVIVELIF